MPNKTPAIISVISTVVLLLILGAFSFFIDLVVLNGYSESAGSSALISFGLCQSLGLILSAVFSWWLTNRLLAKFNWNKALTVIASVFVSVMLGGILGIPAFILSALVAEGAR
ncbi:MAG: hypothetical protein U0V02_22340 [Anaerolineales bacterium]